MGGFGAGVPFGVGMLKVGSGIGPPGGTYSSLATLGAFFFCFLFFFPCPPSEVTGLLLVFVSSIISVVVLSVRPKKFGKDCCFSFVGGVPSSSFEVLQGGWDRWTLTGIQL